MMFVSVFILYLKVNTDFKFGFQAYYYIFYQSLSWKWKSLNTEILENKKAENYYEENYCLRYTAISHVKTTGS